MKKTITTSGLFLVLLLTMAGISHAATDTYSTGYGAGSYGLPVAPPWTTTLSLPQFNPLKGTLTQVDISATGYISGSLGLENTNTTTILPCTGYLKNTITVPVPSGGSLIPKPVTTTQAPTLTVYDGILDFGGTSGITYYNQYSSDTPATKTITGATNLNTYYKGTGTVNFAGITATDTSTKAGGAKCIAQFLPSSGLILTITYTYTPAAPTPEPGTIALLGSGLLAFGINAISRARRRRHINL